MSVRQGLLAILAQGPCYGHQLRQEFEQRTGGTWPLNAGQVYQTLDRLERDELVVRSGEDERGRELYSLTAAGAREATAWLATAEPRGTRDELALKVALAVTLPGADVRSLLAGQRAAAEAVVAAAQAGSDHGTGHAIVRAATLAHAEADLRWLAQVEETLGTAEPYGLSSVAPRRGRPARARTQP